MVLFRKASDFLADQCRVYLLIRHLCHDQDVCPKCEKRRRFKFKLRLASIKRGRARNPEHD